MHYWRENTEYPAQQGPPVNTNASEILAGTLICTYSLLSFVPPAPFNFLRHLLHLAIIIHSCIDILLVSNHHLTIYITLYYTYVTSSWHCLVPGHCLWCLAVEGSTGMRIGEYVWYLGDFPARLGDLSFFCESLGHFGRVGKYRCEKYDINVNSMDILVKDWKVSPAHSICEPSVGPSLRSKSMNWLSNDSHSRWSLPICSMLY